MTVTDKPFVVLTEAAEQLLRAASSRTGKIRMHLSRPDGVLVIDQVEVDADVRVQVSIPREYEALRWGEREAEFAGQWFAAQDLQLSVWHDALWARHGTAMPFDSFKLLFPAVQDPGANVGIVVVRTSDLGRDETAAGLREFTAWSVTREGVFPCVLAVEPAVRGPVQLAVNDAWPVDRLARTAVTVVGIGSIGSAAVDSIAELGVGAVHLVDDDRLLWHNIVRHRLGNESVGRYKVDAMRRSLLDRSRLNSPVAVTDVQAHRVNAVTDAGELFELIRNSSVVLCCADGIASRRAVNHLARIARTPAVFVCVLADGRIGEVFRSRPGRKFGCLLCHRAWLTELGALDPEADQEAAYGQGSAHKPMTAAPSDLSFMGTLGAKMAISTLMEAQLGDSSQRLPSEHAVIGLRPDIPLRWPFNVVRAGEIIWNEVPGPRATCATCSIAG